MPSTCAVLLSGPLRVMGAGGVRAWVPLTLAVGRGTPPILE